MTSEIYQLIIYLFEVIYLNLMNRIKVTYLSLWYIFLIIIFAFMGDKFIYFMSLLIHIESKFNLTSSILYVVSIIIWNCIRYFSNYLIILMLLKNNFIIFIHSIK